MKLRIQYDVNYNYQTWPYITVVIIFSREHIAPVLALTTASNHALVVSGGEDSSIIICSLATGQCITKIDHHRGPVTCVRVTATDDVLVSGRYFKQY